MTLTISRRRLAAVLLALAFVAALAGPLAAHQGRIKATETGAAPTVASCGTATIAGNDTAGIITHTVGAAACTVTFGKAFTSTPICVAQLVDSATQSAQAEGAWVREIATATADITIHYEANSGQANVYAYICIDR